MAARPAVGALQATTPSATTSTTATGTRMKAFPWNRLNDAPVLRASSKSRVPITWMGPEERRSSAHHLVS